MPSKTLYLDYSATTYVRKEVVEAMLPYFTEKFGNPSSIHLWGQETKGAVETAREEVAQLIGANADEIFFTSSGTESNNLALFGLMENGNGRKHLIVSQIEHASVLSPAKVLEKKGFRVTYLPVDRFAKVDLEALKKAISEETLLVSIMHANNEVGTLQPLAEIAKILKEKSKKFGKKIYFHSDAVQSAPILPLNVEDLGVDLMSLSSHKLYGPKGIAALFVRRKTPLSAILYGGQQEKRLRASTENVAGIVGFAKACFLTKKEQGAFAQEMIALRDYFREELMTKVAGLILNGHPTDRLPNHLNFSVPFVEGESLILLLSQKGIAASTGSACSSHSLEPSHVLLAMGISHELAHGSVRFTLGRGVKKEDLKEAASLFASIVETLRKMSPITR
jgi:cysteine desulfurase